MWESKQMRDRYICYRCRRDGFINAYGKGHLGDLGCSERARARDRDGHIVPALPDPVSRQDDAAVVRVVNALADGRGALGWRGGAGHRVRARLAGDRRRCIGQAVRARRAWQRCRRSRRAVGACGARESGAESLPWAEVARRADTRRRRGVVGRFGAVESCWAEVGRSELLDGVGAKVAALAVPGIRDRECE